MNGAQLAAKARHLRPGLKVLLTAGYVADQATEMSDISLTYWITKFLALRS
jgi:hypothetical protein